MRHLAIALLTAISASPFAAEPITGPEDPITIYTTGYPFDEVKENVQMAITGQGMLISGTLHISDMLERTAKDTGFEKLYEKAESLEFCNLQLSYLMSSAHPANLTTCPLTIGIYVKAGEPDTTYVAYQRASLLGESREVTEKLDNLLDLLVREAIE
ncbi:MAG: DUF302 domain-containing protein [Candidatus Sedimenticola endophacoides]